jgi:membrane-associated phospholipid phosphatase
MKFVDSKFILREHVSKTGLIEAAKNILRWIGRIVLLQIFSVIIAYFFWYIRAWISTLIHHSYKAYVIWLDVLIFQAIPSLWVQQNLRHEIFDIFFRQVWLSYVYVLLFGAAFILAVRGQTKRYILSLILTLFLGLFVHYIIPTQPPWMAVEGVIRINGEEFTRLDKNLTAAMPSIHQAVVVLFGCALWQYGILVRLVAILYNILMSLALVYLGEHFFVDSIAGYMLAISCWIIFKRIQKSKLVNLINLIPKKNRKYPVNADKSI